MKIQGFIETFKEGKFIPYSLVELEEEESFLSLFGKSNTYFNSPYMALIGKPFDLCPEVLTLTENLVGVFWTIDRTWPQEFLSRKVQLYHKGFDSFVDSEKLPVHRFVNGLKSALEDAGESRLVVFLED